MEPKAEARVQRTQFVQDLRARLDALLSGRSTREDVESWARAVDVPPRVFAEAAVVVSSLCNAAELSGGVPVLSERDFRAYRRWVTEGEAFFGDDEPLVVLNGSLALLDGHAGPAVRFWEHGLGWAQERRFASPATGRPFVALQLDEGSCIDIRKRREDDAPSAWRDLVATLAFEPSMVRYLQQGLSLDG